MKLEDLEKIEIPSNVKKKLYICLGVGYYNTGRITVESYKPNNIVNKDGEVNLFAQILLKQIEVDIAIDVTIDNDKIVQIMVESLKDQQENLYNEYLAKKVDIESKIGELTAIEYREAGND